MKHPQMKSRPQFPLMGQEEIQKVYHLQTPRWLFSDPRYADMNLEAKMTYVFLLNRFQLSRRNGWLNDHGEVFVIFPRKELAQELRICEKRITTAFRTLISRKLIWEKRNGLGSANHIYLAQVTPMEDSSYTSAPFLDPDEGGCKPAVLEVLEEDAVPEPPQIPSQNRERGTPRTVNEAALEVPYSPSSHKEKSHIDFSQNEVSQSGAGDEPPPLTLDDILQNCDLFSFSEELERCFTQAITQLFNTKLYRLGDKLLAQNQIHAILQHLDWEVLRWTEEKLLSSDSRTIRNPLAYTMATIMNTIQERQQGFYEGLSPGW
ncbi:replication initiator protein A [Bengtsoniella intestinalis]|uniref:replication initiator protein A n=1 Tax=Bengtsoniella intestinalis TaxID=3073143 RepID=UPI00391F7A53